MKHILTLFIITGLGFNALAQDFNANINTAKASYQSGKLEDAHFALQKAMQELDLAIGKEVMKLFPARFDTLKAINGNDNISATSGYVGTTIERSYGVGARKASLSVISNSPMIAVLNSFLNNPALNYMSDPNNKTIKVQGYKAKLEKKDNGDGNHGFEINVPLGSSLVTFNVENITESEAIAMANTIPLSQIAKLIQ